MKNIAFDVNGDDGEEDGVVMFSEVNGFFRVSQKSEWNGTGKKPSKAIESVYFHGRERSLRLWHSSAARTEISNGQRKKERKKERRRQNNVYHVPGLKGSFFGS